MLSEAPLQQNLNLLGLLPDGEALAKALWHRVRQVEELLEPFSTHPAHHRVITHLRVVLSGTMLMLRDQVPDDEVDSISLIPAIVQMCNQDHACHASCVYD